jgi:hypothetical protein
MMSPMKSIFYWKLRCIPKLKMLNVELLVCPPCVARVRRDSIICQSWLLPIMVATDHKCMYEIEKSILNFFLFDKWNRKNYIEIEIKSYHRCWSWIIKIWTKLQYCIHKCKVRQGTKEYYYAVKEIEKRNMIKIEFQNCL